MHSIGADDPVPIMYTLWFVNDTRTGTKNDLASVPRYLGSIRRLVKNACLKKNQSAPRPSEHPPVMGEKKSKRLGGIKGCKSKTSSWHLNRFPDADNIGSTV